MRCDPGRSGRDQAFARCDAQRAAANVLLGQPWRYYRQWSGHNGAATYSWSNGSMLPILTVTPTGPTNYSVVGTNSAGCTGTAGIAVNVSPPPFLMAGSDKKSVCPGEPVELTAFGTVLLYTWSGGGANGQGASIIVNPQTTTTYNVTGIGPNGCTGNASVTVIVNDCTAIEENTEGRLTLFPNPVKDVVTIRSRAVPAEVSITDLTGRVIERHLMNEVEIDLALNLKPGVYILNVHSSEGTLTRKLIKE
jgi:hypothetical protein